MQRSAANSRACPTIRKSSLLIEMAFFAAGIAADLMQGVPEAVAGAGVRDVGGRAGQGAEGCAAPAGAAAAAGGAAAGGAAAAASDDGDGGGDVGGGEPGRQQRKRTHLVRGETSI